MTTPQIPPASSHAVVFYEDDDALVAELATYARTGLRANGRVTLLTTPRHAGALRRALSASGTDAGAAEASGQLTTLDAEETLAAILVDGLPDRTRMEAVLGRHLTPLAGGGPVSAYGEMVALLWQAGNESAALALEARWNALQADLGFALLCSYPRSVLRGSALPLATQLCREHTDSALRGDNPVALAASDHGFSEVFVPSPSAVPAARNFVRRALHTAEPAVEAADVVLVACELVTNAVRHAASAFCLRVAGVNNAVRLEIEDTSPRSPTPRPVSASAVGGRGLALVDSLTNAWGHYATSSGGKVVWAEFTA